MILHTEFGLIWTTPWPDEKEFFLKFSKIPNSRNSQNSVWKPIFFPRTAIRKILLALHSHYTGDTSYRVWFDVDNSLPDEKDLFLKIYFSRNSKSSAWNPNFFSRYCIPIFFLCTLISLLIFHTAFGLIWTTPWPDEKEFFLKFSKIPTSRNSQKFFMKIQFFS